MMDQRHSKRFIQAFARVRRYEEIKSISGDMANIQGRPLSPDAERSAGVEVMVLNKILPSLCTEHDDSQELLQES